ncbi:MAG: hypothetical protein E6J90_53280 [Deltaproteobacteria bacterium]|nr:MAG: hypothetical protein E6J90_53280 [Deltaproteobacteria bacterium]TMQ04666.1 MAG: hypothetical protein E6J91_42900 [Deltaproteobacteria bacterium]
MIGIEHPEAQILAAESAFLSDAPSLRNNCRRADGAGRHGCAICASAAHHGGFRRPAAAHMGATVRRMHCATPEDADLIAPSATRVLPWVVAAFNGVKIFSATMFADRGQLGDRITAWLSSSPHRKLTDIIVTQSSDAAFHCLTFSIFYQEAPR